MQDFMQSLQMRCPVPAQSGLSIMIIASAPMHIALASEHVRLGNFLVEWTAFQHDVERIFLNLPLL